MAAGLMYGNSESGLSVFHLALLHDEGNVYAGTADGLYYPKGKALFLRGVLTVIEGKTVVELIIYRKKFLPDGDRDSFSGKCPQYYSYCRHRSKRCKKDWHAERENLH